MTFLLDTHTLLWFLRGDARLSATAQALIHDPANTIWVSIASCWEIAIKVGTGKLQLGESSRTLLPITLDHATAVESLPHHHRDPFDRLLVAQALAEGIPIISGDTSFDSYGVDRRW